MIRTEATIRIEATGAATLVQDLGRFGHRMHGVGTAGFMDPVALRIGNRMLGNPDGAAGLEIGLFPFRARFLVRTGFALTGADCAATLDGRPVPPWWAMTAGPGQRLELRPPRSPVIGRACLAIRHGIAVAPVLGSRSTQLRGAIGGLHGRALRRDDGLPGSADDGAALDHGLVLPVLPVDGRPLSTGADRPIPIRVIVAGEYDRFGADARQAFWDTDWRIDARSNRAGYRLAGPALPTDAMPGLRSYGVVPGLIQVPPAGQPIVQMADANVSGGYPKIAAVIGADLWRLGRATPGASVRFVPTDAAGARRARQELDAWLDAIDARIRRWHADAPAPPGPSPLPPATLPETAPEAAPEPAPPAASENLR